VKDLTHTMAQKDIEGLPTFHDLPQPPPTLTAPAGETSPVYERHRTSVDAPASPDSDTNVKEKEYRKSEGQHEIVSDESEAEGVEKKNRLTYQRLRPFILSGFLLLILAWWISATVLKATRHRWIVQTLFAWTFILCVSSSSATELY
jgi:CNT family concentrative nucleoside transporter